MPRALIGICNIWNIMMVQKHANDPHKYIHGRILDYNHIQACKWRLVISFMGGYWIMITSTRSRLSTTPYFIHINNKLVSLIITLRLSQIKLWFDIIMVACYLNPQLWCHKVQDWSDCCHNIVFTVYILQDFEYPFVNFDTILFLGSQSLAIMILKNMLVLGHSRTYHDSY